MQVRQDISGKLLTDLGRSRRAAMLTTDELSRLADVSSMHLFLIEYHGLDLLEPAESERVARALAIFIRARQHELANLVPEERGMEE